MNGMSSGGTTTGLTTISTMSGVFTVGGGGASYAVQQWCTTTKSTNGLGAAVGSGNSEVYTIVNITQLA